MCGHMQEGGLGAADALLRVYGARTDTAIGKYVAALPREMHEEITNILMQGQAQAYMDWKCCRDGVVDVPGPDANDDDAESDSAEDEIDDDDDDDDADADGGEDADVLTSQKRRPSKKPSAAAARKATFDYADVDDIDALFEKAEKHKQKALGTLEDVLPGDGDTLAGAVKPRKKLKKNADDAPKKKKKTTSKAS